MLETVLKVIYCLLVILALGWWINGKLLRRGVKGPRAYLPFLGNMERLMTGRVHFNDLITKIYNAYPDEKYVGFMEFLTPVFVVKDLDLIKSVAIKDFDHFMNHVFNLEGDLAGRQVLSSRGQHWRDMRGMLSPIFSTSKMRTMFQHVVESTQRYTDYYTQQMELPENKARGWLELEMYEDFVRYATDIIASAIFGLETNSFLDKNNSFYLTAISVEGLTGFHLFKFFIKVYFPRVSEFFNMKFHSDKVINYYRKLVWDTMKYREENNIVRRDMIQLLMEVWKGTLSYDVKEDEKLVEFALTGESPVEKKKYAKKDWAEDDIVAQAFNFINSGLEASPSVLCVMCHLLAYNPDAQRKLQAEIDEVADNLQGELLTYDTLRELKYMDMVLSETLRIYPPAMGTERICTKDYTLPPSSEGEKSLPIYVGESFWLPIFQIHRDPKYWENPTVFDPERFSPENKHKIVPNSFFPFGLGPRMCMGTRFTLMLTKGCVFHLLRKFDVFPIERSRQEIEFRPDSIQFVNKNGYWFGLRPRNI